MAIFITPGGAGTPGGSSGQLQVNSSGAFGGVTGSSVDGSGNITIATRWISSLNGAASAPPGAFTGTWFTGGTATTTKPHVLIEPTGTTSTAWSTSGTGLGVNAPSGFTGNLLDLQVNGTSRCIIDRNGGITLSSAIYGSGNFAVNDAIGNLILLAQFGRLYLGATISLSNNNPGNGPDVLITRDAANTLAQRNGTNANTFRVYNTFTSATNFELAKVEWASNILRIGTEKGSGGGTARAMELQTDGVTRLTVGAAGGLTVSDANDIALGTTTGTKIGTATTQKLGFYNATPVVQPTAVADITTTATAGTLPTADGTVTIADATTPTVTELLEYCVELESKLEAALAHLRTLGLIAT